jgi:hypothetical protein
MKTIFAFILLLSLTLTKTKAQNTTQNWARKWPLTFSAFATSPGTFLESGRPVSLPTLIKGGAGVKAATELYYRNRQSSQLFQTLNLGTYVQLNIEKALFVSTELGYRKYIGPVFGEVLMGAGLLRSVSVHSFEVQREDGTYLSSKQKDLKLAPTATVGLGYRFGNGAAVFTRYELLVQPQTDNHRFAIKQNRMLHVGGRIFL